MMVQWRAEGGGGLGCSNPSPRNSEGPPKNRAKLNPIVKTVKQIAEFRAPTHQDVWEKRQVRNSSTLAMANKLVVIINSLKVPKN